VTYLTKDASSYDGQPVELLEIQYGPGEGDVVRTTSGDRDVVIGERLYQAFTTSRDAFDDEGNPDDAKQLSIRVPRDHPFILKFDEQEFPNMVAIRIKRMHLNDPDLGTYNIWSGRLVGLSYEHPWMVLGGEKIATSLSRTGCRIRYMRQCPHTLYMPRCWVDKEAYKYTINFLTMDPSKQHIVISSSLPGGPDRFKGGILRLGSLTRFIVQIVPYGMQGAWQLTLSRPLLALNWGDRVDLFPGCDRLAATCAQRFNNLLNYGGFDFIPPKGPFEGISIV
jgi:uncharacterized phage protein (TIGR02218 family)